MKHKFHLSAEDWVPSPDNTSLTRCFCNSKSRRAIGCDTCPVPSKRCSTLDKTKSHQLQIQVD